MGKFFKSAGLQKEIYKLLKPETLRMRNLRTFDDIRKMQNLTHQGLPAEKIVAEVAKHRKIKRSPLIALA